MRTYGVGVGCSGARRRESLCGTEEVEGSIPAGGINLSQFFKGLTHYPTTLRRGCKAVGPGNHRTSVVVVKNPGWEPRDYGEVAQWA